MRFIDLSSQSLTEGYYSTFNYENILSVKQIIDEVQQFGDVAVRKYADHFDELGSISFEVSEAEIRNAFDCVSPMIIESLEKASTRIKQFAELQMSSFNDVEIITEEGTLGHKIIPLERVGCYVPGGTYPLPSTALMTVIPAKVAGVAEIIVCSPKITSVTIVAAKIAGADRIFRIGGVQAIAAMAYGTNSIPSVDKIIGPGNKYVTAAKKYVYGKVGIDFLAGPSEIMIIADEQGNPELIAADLLAQAEHDILARCDFITTSSNLVERVKSELEIQLRELSTKNIAEQSINNSYIILVETLEQAIEIVNKKAPEHLELQLDNPEVVISKLRNYGSLFIGKQSAEVFGDYCSGPNHTLPTNGAAKYTGGLSVKDFVKFVTYQKLNKINELIEISNIMASMEGLDAHKKAALLRKC